MKSGHIIVQLMTYIFNLLVALLRRLETSSMPLYDLIKSNTVPYPDIFPHTIFLNVSLCALETHKVN